MAQAYVRLSSQISAEVDARLEELLKIIEPAAGQKKTTKTQVVEQAINELYEKYTGDK